MLKSSKTVLRPLFVFNRCRVYHNALEGTRLKGPPQIHFWLLYAQQSIEGNGCKDINRLIKLGNAAAQSWRPIFILQMQDLGLTKLVQWIDWQRKRRCAQVLKINKWLNSFDKLA
ncbi:hypothetical protein [Entomomonas asaccharolytica]|uniref:Uncharacterized protein n=1 Tax=Entomomonas asaccharolytica TaxID=2785331 RepID=A0A974RXD5_9GAMM|nr:hypothetical protein [Entomomonas asaccharolytica]QQP86075.1 hypothetical protein JHT90_02125 [Entomomonas asaccharolytica]